MAKKNNLILIGFMGSGKTSVGNGLVNKCSYDLIDTDAFIEQREHMTINEIFETKGQDYFRDLETEVLEEFNLNLSNTVLSTGGGIILREKNRELLKKLGTVVYLSVTADTVIERLKYDNTRPLLAGGDKKAKVIDILSSREDIYQSAADVVIETDDKSIDKIIELILKHME